MMRFVRTAAHALTSALVTLGLLAGHLAWAVPWMDHRSTSVGTNLLLILAWMALALLASAFLAVALADRLLGRGWRGAVLGSADDAGDDDGDVSPLASVRTRTPQFSILIVVCTAVVILGSNAATGDFFERYRRVGYMRAALAGDNTTLKIDALGRMADEVGPVQAERLPLAIDVLDDEDRRVRRAAVVTIARIARAIQANLGAMVRARVGGDERWEVRVHEILRRDVLPSLIALLGGESGGGDADVSDDTRVRAAAWLLLGSVAPDRLVESVASEDATVVEVERRAQVVALARLGRPRAVPALETLLRVDGSPSTDLEPREPSMQAIVMWALSRVLERYEPPPTGQVDPRVDRAVALVAEHVESTDLCARCAAVDALRAARDSRRDTLLFEALAATSANQLCPSRAVEVADGPGESICAEGSVRFKLLEAIAAIAVGNRRVKARLEYMLSEPERWGDELLVSVGGILRSVAHAEGE